MVWAGAPAGAPVEIDIANPTTDTGRIAPPAVPVTAGSASNHEDAADPDAFARLMPFYAYRDGVVFHETDPLTAAWPEPEGDVVTIFLGIGTGLSPVDVSVVALGELLSGEVIISVERHGVVVAGRAGSRELLVP